MTSTSAELPYTSSSSVPFTSPSNMPPYATSHLPYMAIVDSEFAAHGDDSPPTVAAGAAAAAAGGIGGEAADVMRALVTVQWAENWLNLAFSVYFVKRVAETALIHPNMRVLLTWSLVMPYNMLMVARMGAQLSASSSAAATSASRLVLNLLCVASNFLLNLAQGPCALAILALAVERLLATVFRQTYEVYGRRFAVTLNLITYSASGVYSLWLVVADFDGHDFAHSANRCVSDAEDRPTALVVLWMIAALSCYAGSLMFALLYRWNLARISRANNSDDLATRYQCRQNIATTRALMPGVAPYALLVLGGVTLAVYTACRYDLRAAQTRQYVQLNFQILYMLCDVYTLIFKFLFLFQYPPLRYRLRRDVCRLMCRDGGAKVAPRFAAPVYETNPRAVAEMYFAQLNDEWRQQKK